MQVVLLEDVKALEKKGQIANVNDGYTRDFILSKKLGAEADSKDLNDLRLKKTNNGRIVAEQLTAAKGPEARLDDSSIALTIKAEKGGRTFGSMSFKKIAKAIGDQLGIDIDRKKVMLSDPVKSIGSFEVPVKLHKDITTRLTVKVVEA